MQQYRNIITTKKRKHHEMIESYWAWLPPEIETMILEHRLALERAPWKKYFSQVVLQSLLDETRYIESHLCLFPVWDVYCPKTHTNIMDEMGITREERTWLQTTKKQTIVFTIWTIGMKNEKNQHRTM